MNSRTALPSSITIETRHQTETINGELLKGILPPEEPFLWAGLLRLEWPHAEAMHLVWREAEPTDEGIQQLLEGYRVGAQPYRIALIDPFGCDYAARVTTPEERRAVQ